MRNRVVAMYKRWLAAPALLRISLFIVLVGILLLHPRSISLYSSVIAALVITDSYISRRVQRDEPLAPLGFPEPNGRLMLGSAIGMAALISVTVGIFALRGWYHVESVSFAPRTIASFVVSIVLFTFAAAVEEIVVRGLIWRWMESKWGSWAALGGSSLIFGAGHLLNPNASTRAALAIASEAGLLFGAIFLLTRSLWVTIAGHMAWNLFEGPVYGTMVSGLHRDSIIRSATHGPTLWTGGAFGPEAGMVCLILGTGVAIVLLAVAVRDGKMRKPETASEASPAAT